MGKKQNNAKKVINYRSNDRGHWDSEKNYYMIIGPCKF